MKESKSDGGDEGVGPRGARRVLVEPVFGEPLVQVAVGPVLESLRALPVEGLVVGPEARGPAGEVVHGQRLRHHLGRVARGRDRRPELARRVEQQRVPVRGRHVAGRRWGGAGGPIHLHGPVGMVPPQTALEPSAFACAMTSRGDPPAELEAGAVVARILKARLHARPARLLGHGLEGRRFERQEVRENGGRGLRRRRVLGWIGRAVGYRQRGPDVVVHLAGTRPPVVVLRFPGRDRRVVHRESHVRVDPMRVGGRGRAGQRPAGDQVDPAVGRGPGVPVLDLLAGRLVEVAGQVFELPQLGPRAGVRGRPADPVVLAGRDHPGPPLARLRLDLTAAVARSVSPAAARSGSVAASDTHSSSFLTVMFTSPPEQPRRASPSERGGLACLER